MGLESSLESHGKRMPGKEREQEAGVIRATTRVEVSISDPVVGDNERFPKASNWRNV